MTNSLIEKRIAFAIRYLRFDAETREMTWLEASNLFNSINSYSLPELMVLIHPRFLNDLNLKDKAILGGDFVSYTSSGQKCRSLDLWGYACPFQNSKIHIDHSFPRSRGGATHPQNAMYLCEEHNLPKSSDVHIYPWEELPSNIEWVDLILERLVHAQLRATGDKIHFAKEKRQLA